MHPAFDEYPNESGLNAPERSIVAPGQPAVTCLEGIPSRVPAVLAAGRCRGLARYRLCAALALMCGDRSKATLRELLRFLQIKLVHRAAMERWKPKSICRIEPLTALVVDELCRAPRDARDYRGRAEALHMTPTAYAQNWAVRFAWAQNTVLGRASEAVSHVAREMGRERQASGALIPLTLA